LRAVLDAVEGWYDPRWAEAWDAVGLVCGDPDEQVSGVLLAVDAVPATVAEAVEIGAQLLLTHHPLLLTGVHGVPADDPKGALVHRMIRSGIAHYVAHTNADVARPGVSDALAGRLGLQDLRPLIASNGELLDKLVVFVPPGDAPTVIDALAAAGAGNIGDYDRCAWTGTGEGTFRAGPQATPTIGERGDITVVTEARVEMVLPRSARSAVLSALVAAHPYEQPAFDLVPMAELPSGRGTGRVGTLAVPLTLRELLALAGRRLPATVWGVRAAGDPDALITTVAVCGGSGASMIEDARAAGAAAYLTADLKHHSTLEAVAERGPGLALIDAAHWATERPWLDELAGQLRGQFGTTVDVTVSKQVTDPWTLHAPSIESSTNHQ
jgi:dinuclear metal center YbgI/SA1388 family protein